MEVLAMRTWVITDHRAIKPEAEAKWATVTTDTLKMSTPCLHPWAIFAPMCHANHADLSNHWSSCDQTWGWSQVSNCYYRYPENVNIMFAPMSHICTHVPCFVNTAKLHNSEDQDISKFVYMCLCLVVCFYRGHRVWSAIASLMVVSKLALILPY